MSNGDGARVYGKSTMLALYRTPMAAQAGIRIRKDMPEVDFGCLTNPTQATSGLPQRGGQFQPSTNGHTDANNDGEKPLRERPTYQSRRTPSSLGSLSTGGASNGPLSVLGVLPNDHTVPTSTTRRRLGTDAEQKPAPRSSVSHAFDNTIGGMRSNNGPTSPAKEGNFSFSQPALRSDELSSWRRSTALTSPSKDEKDKAPSVATGFGSGGGLLFTSPTKARRLGPASGTPTAVPPATGAKLSGGNPNILHEIDGVSETKAGETGSDADPFAALRASTHRSAQPFEAKSSITGTPPASWDSDEEDSAIKAQKSMPIAEGVSRKDSGSLSRPLSLDQSFEDSNIDALLQPRRTSKESLPISSALLSEDPLLSSLKPATPMSLSLSQNSQSAKQQEKARETPDRFGFRELPASRLGQTNHAATSQSSSAIMPPLPQTEAPPPGLGASPEDLEWSYKDPSGTIQGPFSGLQMQSWYSAQYFNSDLLIRRLTMDEAFQRLQVYVSASGSPERPFLQPAMAKRNLLLSASQRDVWRTANSQANAPRQFASPAAPFTADHLDYLTASSTQNTVPQLRQFSHNFDPFLQSHGQGHSGLPLPLNGVRSPSGTQNATTPSQTAELWAQQHSPWPQTAGPYNIAGQRHQPDAHTLHEHSLLAALGIGAHQLSPFDRSAALSPQQPGTDKGGISSPLAFASQSGQAVNSHFLTDLQSPQSISESLSHDVLPSSAGVQIAPSSILASAARSSAESAGAGQEDQHNMAGSANIFEKNLEASSASPPHTAAAGSPSPAEDETITVFKSSATDIGGQAAAEAPTQSRSKKAASKKSSNASVSGTSTVNSKKPPVKNVIVESPAKKPTKVNKQTVSLTAPQLATKSTSLAAASEIRDEAAENKEKQVPWSAKDTPQSGPSLREIQAREAKEDEIKKAAARKVKAAALAAEQARLAALEEAASLPAASTWAANSPPISSQPSSHSTAAPAPAWSSTTNTKKTLKEIQEEEARQQEKRNSAQKAAGVIPHGKGYAGMLGPSTASVPLAASRPLQQNASASTSGPWSVVGSGGKSVAAVSAAAAAASAPKMAVVAQPAARTVSNTVATNGNATSAKANGKKRASVMEHEASPPPSLEFLKWMRSALQGLSINIDDFVTMLLTFPVNADPATLEIISDAVYLNSRTLDGRRFAETFVFKRKADVAAAKAMPATQATSPPTSAQAPKTAAEALKSVPKKPETINFKTVKPKKKAKP